MAGYARCLYQLQQGGAHWNYPGGPWKTCITPNQHQTLFGPGIPLRKAPPRWGKGVFAGVYSRDADTVVKITRDKSDVDGLNLAQETGFVPKVFATYRLTSPAYWSSPKYAVSHSGKPRPAKPEAFAMVVERLQPLKGADRGAVNKIASCISHWSRGGDEREVEDACCPKSRSKRARAATSKLGNSAPACSTDVKRLSDMYYRLADYNIEWRDMHGGNFGRDKHGQLKVLDLGVSAQVQEDSQHDALDGARRRGRAKKRR